MKLGTDAVLLGCIAAQPAPAFILDIGTGSGVIALQLAQRFPEAHILGIEIDDTSAAQAALNFAASPWAKRLACLRTDVCTWESDQKFDLIVSNPPYFKDSFPIENEQRKIARGQHTLDSSTLMQRATELLADDGSFWFISPLDYFETAAQHLQLLGLNLARQTLIHPIRGKPANRIIACFTKITCLQSIQDRLTIRETTQAYTTEYLKLTQAFYLFA